MPASNEPNGGKITADQARKLSDKITEILGEGTDDGNGTRRNEKGEVRPLRSYFAVRLIMSSYSWLTRRDYPLLISMNLLLLPTSLSGQTRTAHSTIQICCLSGPSRQRRRLVGKLSVSVSLTFWKKKRQHRRLVMLKLRRSVGSRKWRSARRPRRRS